MHAKNISVQSFNSTIFPCVKVSQSRRMKRKCFQLSSKLKLKLYAYSVLRWMETVCSTFQDLQFDGSL